MKRIVFFMAAAAALLCGCHPSRVKLSGRFAAIGDTDKVYLEQITHLSRSVIDSVTLDREGNFAFVIDDVPRTPSFYNLIVGGDAIPLLLAGGDRVSVNSVGSAVRNYTVEGSEESDILREFYQMYVGGLGNLNEITSRYDGNATTESQRKETIRRYNEEYRRIKREQLRFIAANKNHLAAIYALYQRIPGEQYLYNADNDIIYYKTVADAIEQSYPETPYLPAMHSEISRMEARAKLLSNIVEAGYPDITMPDMFGNEHTLSSLAGKVVLLCFWSAENGACNAANADLKAIYERYAPKGFEIYQVSVDTSKALWISTVQEQALPWISVSDLRGGASAAVGMYNIKTLPASFLISKDGNIAAKNIFGEELESRLAQMLD